MITHWAPSGRHFALNDRLLMRASVGAIEAASTAPPAPLRTRPWWATDVGVVVIIGGVLLLIASPFIFGYYVLTRG